MVRLRDRRIIRKRTRGARDRIQATAKMQAGDFDSLPYLTAELPGVGGALKQEPEDFMVDEIAAYEPSGEGEHLFLWVEKRDISGEDLVRHIGRRLAIPSG